MSYALFAVNRCPHYSDTSFVFVLMCVQSGGYGHFDHDASDNMANTWRNHGTAGDSRLREQHH